MIMGTHSQSEHDFIRAHMGLAGRAVGRMLGQFPWLDADELASQANLGLLRAARFYRPERGVRFSTYAMTVIGNRLIDVQRAECRRRRHEVPVANLTHVPAPRRRSHDEGRRELCRLLRPLSLEQKKLLVAHYLHRMTHARLARRLGIGPSTVRARLRRALERCRRELED